MPQKRLQARTANGDERRRGKAVAGLHFLLLASGDSQNDAGKWILAARAALSENKSPHCVPTPSSLAWRP